MKNIGRLKLKVNNISDAKMVYLPENVTLLQAYKQLSKNKFTIFFFNNKVLTGENIINFCEKYSYDDKLYFIIEKNNL